MKVKQLQISNFLQFKDIVLDFVYPKGHVKEGKPLDKVCLIGQSGTGKTNLLKLLKTLFVRTQSDFESEIMKNSKIAITINENGDDNTYFTSEYRFESPYKPPTDIRTKLFYYPAEINFDFKSERPAPLHTSNGLFMFENNVAKQSLDLLLAKIRKYRDNETNFLLSLARKISDDKQENLELEKQQWYNENPNPVKDLAERCLDKVLNKFYLRTRSELIDVRDIKELQIERVNTDTLIPFKTLSTGTKQVIITALPLYLTEANNAIVLFDEPERSLFPDIQRDLIYYYQSLVTDCQFIYATHSPIIASQFEPCERFILRFNETGNVEVSNGIVPEGDDPNDLLFFDFQMTDLMTKEGVKSYSEYLDLKNKIRFEENEEIKEQYINRYLELGNQFNYFNENAANYKK